MGPGNGVCPTRCKVHLGLGSTAFVFLFQSHTSHEQKDGWPGKGQEFPGSCFPPLGGKGRSGMSSSFTCWGACPYPNTSCWISWLPGTSQLTRDSHRKQTWYHVISLRLGFLSIFPAQAQPQGRWKKEKKKCTQKKSSDAWKAMSCSLECLFCKQTNGNKLC